MELNIKSFQKVGNIEFGTKREKVRKLLGTDFSIFKKSLKSKNTTDDYSNLGLHLYYDLNDKIEFIEMFPPSNPVFKGINLLKGNTTDIINRLLEYDSDPETDEAGYIFYKIGIAIYIEDQIEAVSAFVKDYYEI